MHLCSAERNFPGLSFKENIVETSIRVLPKWGTGDKFESVHVFVQNMEVA